MTGITSEDIRHIIQKDFLIKRNSERYYIDLRLQDIFDNVKKLIESRGGRNWRQNIEDLEKNVDVIMFALKAVYRQGRLIEALDSLYDAYFSDSNFNPNPDSKNLRVNYFYSRKNLFRMRYNDNPDSLFLPSEMFHVPIGKSSFISNSRYNETGFPILYLSESIYCAWIETGAKELNKQNIAVFKPTSKLGYIDVLLYGDNYPIKRYGTLPLIIACNLPVIFKGSHIPEYIIPQLLMHCIIKARGKGKGILGVRYISSHINNEERLLFPNNKHLFKHYINYAIPPFGNIYDDNGTDTLLQENFHLVSIESPSGKCQHYNEGLVKDSSYCYSKRELEDIKARLNRHKLTSQMLTCDSLYGAQTC